MAAAFDHHIFGLQGHIEMGHPAFVGQVYGPHIGLRIEAIGDDTAIRDLAHQRLHIRIIGAAHGQPVKRNVGHKIVKPLMQRASSVPQCSICSGSILVTMAMVAGRRLKVPSDSSASTTIHSPSPLRALSHRRG